MKDVKFSYDAPSLGELDKLRCEESLRKNTLTERVRQRLAENPTLPSHDNDDSFTNPRVTSPDSATGPQLVVGTSQFEVRWRIGRRN